ncbi:stromal cell-derived factor 2-like protein-like [Hibiscus syriacus]|uniref:Stromal cell-derived factor 2-like protein-like n=1 Tax=Hibiscus syriacus TaxID=106335 RepID=A0A6A2YT07_HIBSY|nr:U-box domain-containing protein 7-like [Hibiscus syriacus]KAE8682554.1 stromal cell-derived factor 2-like protein-like [Hibiscus syriacus]
MAKCHRNDIGSVAIDRPSTISTTGNNFRLWTAFSGTAFRRKIFDAVSCGASSRHRDQLMQEILSDTVSQQPPPTTTMKSALKEFNEPRKPDKAVKKPIRNGRSEKLADLLNLVETKTDAETKRKVEALEELKIVVKELQGEDKESKRKAATRVRSLTKEDSEARVTLAMLGTIPPLVAMLDFEDSDSQIAALYALLNLGIGNGTNKASIVKAGAVHKMLKLIESPNEAGEVISDAVVANFLSLSALDSNKPIIGSSGAIPFLVKSLKILDTKTRSQARHDALRALYNLSIFPSNISFMSEADSIPCLLNALGDMEVSERILSILSNVVSTPEGTKGISIASEAFPILVDVLNWTDSPVCQEKASYILMVMAHKAYGDRHAMIEAGIVSALLELTLLGSTLAQKRASRILEVLRVDKGKQVSENNLDGNMNAAAVSAPICSSSRNPNGRVCLVEEEGMMSEEKKAVKQLVQQSLQNNMRRIVNRANLPQDFVPSELFKSLTASSSKSLPF